MFSSTGVQVKQKQVMQNVALSDDTSRTAVMNRRRSGGCKPETNPVVNIKEEETKASLRECPNAIRHNAH